MSRASALEKLTARIHELLEQDSNATITWNAKIPDPDNPKQLRQVDIEILRDGKATHVECRSHVDPQNTKWIEELVGRQISLNADQMIAVSDSGFTEGAMLKANRYGIVLRNFSELTDLEILNWGKQTIIELYYYRLVNVQVALRFNDTNVVCYNCLRELFTKENDLVRALVNSVKYPVNSILDKVFPLCVQQQLNSNGNFDVCGSRLIGASIRTEVELAVRKFSAPSVRLYSGTEQRDSSIGATVESDTDSELEVIKSGLMTSIILNLSKLPESDTDMVFGGVILFDLRQPSTAPKFELTGWQEQPVTLSNVQVSVLSAEA